MHLLEDPPRLGVRRLGDEAVDLDSISRHHKPFHGWGLRWFVWTGLPYWRQLAAQQATDKITCQIQYLHMEATERDLFCSMMSNKDTRDQVLDAAAKGLTNRK